MSTNSPLCTPWDHTRSHFDAQDFMESGTPGEKATTDGWLNRYLQRNQEMDTTPFRAVAISATLPRLLAGPAPALTIERVAEFGIRAGTFTAEVEELFADVYKDTFDAVRMLRSATSRQYAPAAGVRYP